jgi:hypothetical protein
LPGSKVNLVQKADGCIDGTLNTTSFTSEMTMNVKSKFDVPGRTNVDYLVEGKGTYTVSEKELPKK